MRGLRLAALLAAVLAAAGCQSLGYYAQAAWGQVWLLQQRQPVERLLQDLSETADPKAVELRERLAYSQRVLGFAETALGLPVGRNYRAYVELERPYVVWTLFAAPELSLEPVTWCYPIVGCAPYRGYFSETAANLEAARLQRRGMDVHLGGVAAYSTLGWFADPLLSSFIYWSDAGLAELLFHELAHGAVWLPGDVAFNESFATFVGAQGLVAFRSAGEAAPAATGEVSSRAAWRGLLQLLEATRERLDALYRSEQPPAAQYRHKQRLVDGARGCYQAHREMLGGGRFDELMAGLNNAVLVSISTYEDLVPAFEQLFLEQDADWPRFFEAVRALVEQPDDDRRSRLERLRDQQIAEQGDDHDAEQIQCEAFFRHGGDGEAVGAEHDDIRRGRHG